MSHRRQRKPRWFRHTAAAAGVIIVAGGGFLAQAAVSGGSDSGRSRSGSALTARNADNGGTPLAAGRAAASGGTATPSPKPSGSSSPTPTGTGRSTTHAATPTGTAATGSTRTAPATQAGPSAPAPAAVFTGLAFDTCTAPSLSTMNAWHADSPYGAAAVYVGGQNRGCSQPQLTTSWVASVHASGWRLIPIYVGAQPPCQTSGNPERITAGNAASLGASDAADAVAKASGLGMRSGSAIYLDVEAYDTSDTSCVTSVLTYIQAWDRAAHARGYVAGFYGFTSSSAAAVARAKSTTPDMPDVIWYARYDDNASTTTGFPFSSGLWTGHRRGHQYQVNQRETYGGASLTVDHDAWDAPVAAVG